MESVNEHESVEKNQKQIYYKIIGDNHKYHLGLNAMKEAFDDSSSCTTGGLYYTKKEHVWNFLHDGNKICKIEIPDDAKQVRVTSISGTCFKSDKINILELQHICVQTIIDWDLPMMHDAIACMYGYLDVLQHLQSLNEDTFTVSLYTASTEGQVHILDWWYDYTRQYKRRFALGHQVLECIDYTHHVPVLEWFYNKKDMIPFRYTSKAVDNASNYGHISVLDWWFRKNQLNNVPFEYTDVALDGAAFYGQAHVLDWWLDKYIKYNIPLKYTNLSILRASRENHINVLDWWLNKYLQYKDTKRRIEFKWDKKEIKKRLRNSHKNKQFHKFDDCVLKWWANFFEEYEVKFNWRKCKREIRIKPRNK